MCIEYQWNIPGLPDTDVDTEGAQVIFIFTVGGREDCHNLISSEVSTSLSLTRVSDLDVP